MKYSNISVMTICFHTTIVSELCRSDQTRKTKITFFGIFQILYGMKCFMFHYIYYCNINLCHWIKQIIRITLVSGYKCYFLQLMNKLLDKLLANFFITGKLHHNHAIS